MAIGNTLASRIVTAATLSVAVLGIGTALMLANDVAGGQDAGVLPGASPGEHAAIHLRGGEPAMWKKCDPLWTRFVEPACVGSNCTGPCGFCECLGSGCVGPLTTTRCTQVWNPNIQCCINKDACRLNATLGCVCEKDADAVGVTNWGKHVC